MLITLLSLGYDVNKPLDALALLAHGHKNSLTILGVPLGASAWDTAKYVNDLMVSWLAAMKIKSWHTAQKLVNLIMNTEENLDELDGHSLESWDLQWGFDTKTLAALGIPTGSGTWDPGMAVTMLLLEATKGDLTKPRVLLAFSAATWPNLGNSLTSIYKPPSLIADEDMNYYDLPVGYRYMANISQNDNPDTVRKKIEDLWRRLLDVH
jgi:hypothetical protein